MYPEASTALGTQVPAPHGAFLQTSGVPLSGGELGGSGIVVPLSIGIAVVPAVGSITLPPSLPPAPACGRPASGSIWAGGPLQSIRRRSGSLKLRLSVGAGEVEVSREAA